jgi:hypothetical protein
MPNLVSQPRVRARTSASRPRRPASASPRAARNRWPLIHPSPVRGRWRTSLPTRCAGARRQTGVRPSTDRRGGCRRSPSWTAGTAPGSLPGPRMRRGRPALAWIAGHGRSRASTTCRRDRAEQRHRPPSVVQRPRIVATPSPSDGATGRALLDADAVLAEASTVCRDNSSLPQRRSVTRRSNSPRYQRAPHPRASYPIWPIRFGPCRRPRGVLGEDRSAR